MDPVFAIAIFVLMISCLGFFVCKKSAHIKTFFESHPFALKLLLWGYIVFNACFSFPICSVKSTIDFPKSYLLISSYGAIAFSFAGIYGSKKHLAVLFQTFTFCSLGLICRYFLEYGEVSNSYNFTLLNIALYLTAVPVYTVLSYVFLDSKLKKDIN